MVHRREQWEVTANGYGVSLCGDRNVLELDGGHGYTTLNILTIELYTFKGRILWYVI